MNIERALVLTFGVTLLSGCAAYGNVSSGEFDPANVGEANRQIDLLNHKMVLKDVLMDLKLPPTGSDRAKKK